MKKISKMLSLITGICVISMSCERDTITELNSVLELTVPIDPRVKQLSDSDNHRLISTKDPYEREDVLLEKFSKSLSKSLKEKNFRDFIKSEANKQFDGDYDILVLNHLSELIDGKKLSDAIVSSGVITHDELTELTKIKKDLNIAIPANIEKWNTTNQAPVVTYIPTSYKENKTETVLGFDFNEKNTV